MDGTASGKQRFGVNVAGRAVLALALLVAARPAAAQAPGDSWFRVLQRGVPIGTVEASVARVDDGWRIRSTSRLAGTLNATVKQFDALYDEHWRARFLTVERSVGHESTIVHVALTGGTTRTDIVTDREARWRSHSVSPDTVFLPAYAYAAFEAIAARLHAAGPRFEIPLLIAPDGERRASVSAWERMSVETTAGRLSVARHTLSLVGATPALVHVWVDGGRLLRVDIPSDEISVVRSDVIGP